MALRKDRHGMAMVVDALIFLVVLTLLVAILHIAPYHEDEDRMELLRSYHAVMLSGELPGEDGSSLSSATLSDYLIALSLNGTPSQEQVLLIERMVNGTIAELGTERSGAWLVIELGATELRFGSEPPEGGEVYADRRELGDGSVVSTLFLA